jgi:acyl transferase domain-containing protein/acyl carrier protein
LRGRVIMEDTASRAIAIVGVGAVLPDAANAAAFWENVKSGRYSISEVTPNRWDPALYYDSDHSAPDKTYSKIGGWVREYEWDPLKWRLPIPPRVAAAMDDTQKWAIACTREVLNDYGYPERPLDLNRTAVILGNAMGGEHHYLTVVRVAFPEYARELAEAPSFAALPEKVRRDVTRELHQRIVQLLPEITEDTMPGELANCTAGRVANVFNFRGPNYTTDAACASAMAAIKAAVEGLVTNDFDLAISGGVDRNMGASTFIKFCKIGALSASGTRPYAEGADGFVMGEGAAVFLLKRLADAERDNDKIYAVLRGVGGASDGKGKGITAPNPVGQKLCIERAWKNAGLSPATVTMIEGHGTSTSVGDVVEAQSMVDVLSDFHLPSSSVALGSVKSNFGHLKGAAGAAGLLKATLALRDKVLPPSLHCEHPNSNIDFAHSPLYVNTELRPWTMPAADVVRRAGVSAFGFGGTNFHMVLEEYIPQRLNGNGKRWVSVSEVPPPPADHGAASAKAASRASDSGLSLKAPLRGALAIGAASGAALAERLRSIQKAAEAGRAPAPAPPAEADLRAPERIAIDYVDAADLAEKSAKALKGLAVNQTAMWKALRAQGIYRGHGPAPKAAFLYTGQGSQYVNMLRALRVAEPIVAETFAEADRIMTPLLGKPLSKFVFIDESDANAIAKCEEDLRQTEITQPVVLAIDMAITRLLAAYGIKPDMTMGHSLGEYGALVAAGALPFAEALEAVSARGRGMTQVAVEDKGRMAAVFAPVGEIERILKTIDGYAVVANVNSKIQAVIGGASKAVEQAMEAFLKAGHNAVPLPVSHAFHTSIVAPASEPLRRVLERLHLESPRIPIVANVNGEFYPTGPGAVPQMVDILARQVASPVQFVKGLRTLYDAGARIFVEVGPKKALQGFAEDVLGDREDAVALFCNHPKVGDIAAFNQALCGLYAAGLGWGGKETSLDAPVSVVDSVSAPAPADISEATAQISSLEAEGLKGGGNGSHAPGQPPFTSRVNEGGRSTMTEPMSVESKSPAPPGPVNGARFAALGHLFAEVLDRGWKVYHGENGSAPNLPLTITGAALGLPGTERIFDDTNVARILRGDQFIDAIPMRFRRAMLDKRITRLVKNGEGGPAFESINELGDVVKLAGRAGAFDLEKEFGIPADRAASFDRAASLAIAVGIDALRDAGIPLVMRYKNTSLGTKLPDRWGLPDALRDDTGVIFASVYPGIDSYTKELSSYYADRARREQLALLESLRARVNGANGQALLGQEMDRRMSELRAATEKEPFLFDRHFLFKVISMGHAQFAELIGARGPNTQVNAACASTTQGIGLAEDWIRLGRCRRVIVISADDITSENTLEWFGAAFLSSGAAATGESVEDTAIPFDRRRNGMIIGMGAAALVVESEDAARERGIRPICEILGTKTLNSAFHRTRLDVQHISQVMEDLVAGAEATRGIARHQIAPQMVFVSHETYTPARGGSAAAEVNALRRVFGAAADSIVIANTKGFTGHAMGAGVEDVVAVKALETGCVPPVANFKEVDPELGALNLSKGGIYPVAYALRLGAGFGSQISMTLLRWVRTKDGTRPSPNALGYANRIVDPAAWKAWLSRVTGYPAAELEVVHRTLRIRDQGPATLVAETTQDIRSAPVSIAGPQAPLKEAISETRPPTTAPAGEASQSKVEVQVAPPAPSPGLPSQAAAGADPVKDKVLTLVAKITGYPVDMLDLDLDLEADLGVDTVKQAEMLATVREAYGIARDDKLKLRDFPTLSHVIRFVHERRLDIAGPTGARPTGAQLNGVAAPSEKPQTLESRSELPETPSSAGNVEAVPAPLAPANGSDPAKQRILELVVEKTGYPKDMLDLDLDLEADLGIDTVKQAELLAAIRGTYNIPRDENLRLRDFPTLAHIIRFVYDRCPDLSGTSAVQPAAAPTAGADTPSEKPQTLETRSEPLEASTAAKSGADNRSDAQPESAPPAGSSGAGDAVRERVLAIAAEKTGYPVEMLDLDLDLEADLGIDTVKQAEMFSSVRAAFEIPRDENLKLRDLPTLAHVIKFAQGRGAGSAEAAATPAAQESPADPTSNPQAGDGSTASETSLLSHQGEKRADAVALPRPIPAALDAANAIPRRVPVPNLRPPLTMCKPTGITLGPGRRVVIRPDKAGVGEALAQRLQTMGVEVLQIEDATDASTLADRLKNWLSFGPIQGVYWLSALDSERSLGIMDLGAWREALRLRVKSLYITMHVLYEQIAAPDTFLISATRLGGQHGYDAAGAAAPLGGAVVGFTKTYKRERPDALVKAVDFEPAHRASELAELLIEETLRDPGAMEIGYKGGQRWTVGLEERSAADGQPGLTLDKDTVFLVTGAAGSIVSAITADLAAASGGTFYLLDLVPEPKEDDPDLKRFTSDKEGLKRDLFARIQARGERATPALVEKQLAALERAQAARSVIDTVRAAAGIARYFSVDLTDADAVAKVIELVRAESGRIDVLLHAAGMERSHTLPDKAPAEFDLVFDVKCDGWFNLLHAIGDMPLGATVAFSSIAGRFGNRGQADYSAANDLLCKIASNFRTTRPATRAIAIDWTAWGGIGMAARGSIPKMMEFAGIDMLPPEAGIPLIRRELTAGGTRGEIVVAQRLGILMNEWDSTGGLNATQMEEGAADVGAQMRPPGALPQETPGVMIGRVVSMGLQHGLTIETTLDPKVQPFLYDHQINGKPVLPGVMGIEAFAEAALWMLPGWHIEAVEDVNFLAPFKFYRNDPRTLTTQALISPHGDDLVAQCRLTSERQLPNQTEPQVTTHFTARVRLVKQPPTPGHSCPGQEVSLAGRLLQEAATSEHGPTMGAQAIYQVYFHGPAYQVLERTWRDGRRMVGQMAKSLPNHHHPPDRPTLMAPRLIELCFQTAGLLEMDLRNRLGLPKHVEQVCLWRTPGPADEQLIAVVTPDPDGGSYDAEVVDAKGNRYISLRGYRTVALPDSLDAEPLKVLMDAQHGAPFLLPSSLLRERGSWAGPVL